LKEILENRDKIKELLQMGSILFSLRFVVILN